MTGTKQFKKTLKERKKVTIIEKEKKRDRAEDAKKKKNMEIKYGKKKHSS
jgi:hypothetical protein